MCPNPYLFKSEQHSEHFASLCIHDAPTVDGVCCGNIMCQPLAALFAVAAPMVPCAGCGQPIRRRHPGGDIVMHCVTCWHRLDRTVCDLVRIYADDEFPASWQASLPIGAPIRNTMPDNRNVSEPVSDSSIRPPGTPDPPGAEGGGMPPESWRQRTRPPSDLGGPLPQRRRFDVAANQSTSGRAQQAAIQAAYQDILLLMGEDVLDT